MFLTINIKHQTLAISYAPKDSLIKIYQISTSKFGAGETHNSFKTPRGMHCIRAKIGEGLPANTVFIGRRPTGEIFDASLQAIHPDRDWILTRILWLSGKELGINRLGEVDTMRRYIYIHGCPDGTMLGKTGSIGCVRMANADIIELFGRVSMGDTVNII